MKVRCILLTISTFVSHCCFAALFPDNGQKLNFTEIMFEHPAVKNAVSYRVTVVKKVSGKFNTDPVVVTAIDSTPAVRISKGIRFGTAYMWRYEALNKQNKPFFTSGIFYFSTLNSTLLDTSLRRIAVVKDCKEECAQGLTFIDGLGLAVDRKAIPKWFMPVANDASKLSHYRDLHMTRSGTLLFINDSGAFETDLLGNVLWRTPEFERRSDKEERYHHAFNKEKMNYMVCGRAGITDPETPINGQLLLEYDPSGSEIWRFDASRAIHEKFNIYPSEDSGRVHTLGHLNGFAVDHPKGLIYASFRDFNSIFLIDKRSGAIIETCGNKRISYEEKNEYDERLFAAQHAPVLLKNRNLLLFNNNVPERSSSIVELAIDPSTGSCSKVWEYILEDHVNESPYGNKTNSSKMGIANELPNGNILTALGQLNRIFEITREHKLVWEIYPETRKDTTLPWMEAPSYRVSYAASLYPSYFTIEQLNATSQLKAGQQVMLRINNEGTEADRYTVEVLSDYTESLNLVSDLSKETSAYLDLKVTPIRPITAPVKLKVKVTPASNREKSRELEFELVP